jgi:hypothetical protein
MASHRGGRRRMNEFQDKMENDDGEYQPWRRSEKSDYKAQKWEAKDVYLSILWPLLRLQLMHFLSISEIQKGARGETETAEVDFTKYVLSFSRNLRTKLDQEPGLPDGIISNQKSKFGLILECIAMKYVGKLIVWLFGLFYFHFVYFMTIWYILWSFGYTFPVFGTLYKENLATLLHLLRLLKFLDELL